MSGQPDHLGERVFGLAGGARRAMELDDGLAKAKPGEHAAHETVALGHGEKAVERSAIDQAEIARVTRRRNVAEPPHEAMERSAVAGLNRLSP